MNVLVIGGTGFVGSHVVARLTERGHRVALFHRGETGAASTKTGPAGTDKAVGAPGAGAPPVAEILGDRRHLAAFVSEFCRFGPDVVVDTIPYTEADARLVMEVFRGLAVRLVVLSSQDTYRAYGRLTGLEPGPPEPVPLTEDAPLRSILYPYRGKVPGLEDYDKILVERAVMGDPVLPATVLRLPMVYGPGDGQHRLFAHLRRMDDGRPAILLDEGLAGWRWSRGYVRNVALAVALAVENCVAAGRVYNAAEPEALTTAEWVERIGQAAGWNGRVVRVPRDLLPPALRPRLDTGQDLVADTARLRHELGFAEDVPPELAMRETVAWERANPPHVRPEDFDYVLEDKVLALVEEGAFGRQRPPKEG